jgi:hypothetical protein
MKKDWRATQPASIYNYPTIDMGEHYLSVAIAHFERSVKRPGRGTGRAYARSLGYSNVKHMDRVVAAKLAALKEQHNADQASA